MTTRSMTRAIATIAAALVAASGVAACGDDDDKGADTPAEPAKTTAAPTPAAFAIDATADGKKKAMTFPASVKAGLVTLTLTNSDKKPRSAQVVRIDDAHSVDDVLKIVKSEDNAKIPTWMYGGGGVSTTAPGASRSATQVLAPGKYVIWDDEEGSADEAKGEFTVTGAAGTAELPAVPATVTATEYRFELNGLKAGTNQVRFENTGKQLHHALFFPINAGKTFAEVKKFMTTEDSNGKPPVDFEGGVGTTVIDGGVAQNTTLDLKAGRYAVICFLPDREGGPPHLAKGMITELTVE